jgi:RNA recognition motif-containing protein
MKILVRNLSRETTEAELLALFGEYGVVQYCKLVTDKISGKSKGFGFVEMPRPGEAKAAIKNLNYQEVGGSRIRVKRAEKREDGGSGKGSGATRPKSSGMT